MKSHDTETFFDFTLITAKKAKDDMCLTRARFIIPCNADIFALSRIALEWPMNTFQSEKILERMQYLLFGDVAVPMPLCGNGSEYEKILTRQSEVMRRGQAQYECLSVFIEMGLILEPCIKIMRHIYTQIVEI